MLSVITECKYFTYFDLPVDDYYCSMYSRKAWTKEAFYVNISYPLVSVRNLPLRYPPGWHPIDHPSKTKY